MRVTLALFLTLSIAALAAAEDVNLSGARTQIDGFYATLLECMQRAESLGLAGRRKRLAPVIDRTYDLAFMASKVLGRHWKTLSPEDQARWIELFRKMTVTTYAARFSSFSGEKLEVGKVSPASRGTAVVDTQIVPFEEEPVEIRYRMRETGDGWRIIDVYLNGTVSELALRRSEYSAVIKREGFEHLVSALREKIAAGDPG